LNYGAFHFSSIGLFSIGVPFAVISFENSTLGYKITRKKVIVGLAR